MIKHDSISDQPRQYGDRTYRQIIKHSLDKSQETKDIFERWDWGGGQYDNVTICLHLLSMYCMYYGAMLSHSLLLWQKL